jgi:hypothetical protein
MEEQYSLDFQTPRSEATSTSLDGLSTIPETQPPERVVYEDDTGLVTLTEWDNKLWIHTSLYNPGSTQSIRHYWDVLDQLEDKLREKDWPQLWTAVLTNEQFRFAQVFGFKSSGYCVGDEIEIMVKDL